MIRTIISLEENDKKWLSRRAHAQGVTVTFLIREAIHRMRRQEELSFEDLLSQTSGLWCEGDGLAYQDRVREEW